MRNSKQRDLILHIINHSYHHPTAEDIYVECRKQMPNISLGTVYRNLNLLLNLNQIQKIAIGNVERFDKKIEHQHFICTNCKKIFDIYDMNFPLIKKIDGKIVQEQIVMFRGICEGCQK